MDGREILEKEEALLRKHLEAARLELERWMQRRADAVPAVDATGAKLTHRERTQMLVRSVFGTLRLNVVAGYSKKERRSLTPVREAFFGGRRCAVTPMLVRNVTRLGLEAGSFQKAAERCADWGVSISDDKVMDTIRSVGERCLEQRLPARCAGAAGPEDVLIVMADGWNARHRGPKWGRKKALAEERVEWKDIKSAVLFKLSHVVGGGKGRHALLTRHVVAVPADAGPESFGEAVERAAVRMGLYEAKAVYYFSDGGTYLWNLYEYRFKAVARGTLDYYHAMEHLGTVATELIPDKAERDAWLEAERKRIKKEGGAKLAGTLAEMLKGTEPSAEGRKVAEREINYFDKHKEHMDYGRRRREGVPIGSGAVESLCGQFQDRLKRRGQFWSREGFAAMLRAYVWHMNEELDYAIAPSAA